MRLRIDGGDLSHFQKGFRINWPLAKKGSGTSKLRFLYHKATEGTGFVDDAYATRRAEAKKNGVPFGAYHFAHPAVGTAHAEAEFFLKHAKPAPGDMLPALDLEINDHNLSRAELTTWVNTFFEAVFAYTGVRKAVLYTHYDLNTVPGTTYLWVPRYSNDNRSPVIPTPFKRYSIWQFSDGVYGVPNAIPGVGRCDINHLHWITGLRLSMLRLPSKKPVVKKPTPAKPVQPPAKPPKKKAVNPVYYTVRSGDTLNKIAQQHQLNLAEIEKLNPQIHNPNLIYVGQKVRVK